MKVNIIGVSGSGKTTLSKEISRKLGIDIYSLDYIIYKIVAEGKKLKRIEPAPEQYKKEVFSILKKKSWIVEGKYIIDEVMKNADMIVVFKRNPFLSLYRQWKRYVQDETQRKNHGFKNNILLSISIIKQFYGKEDLKREEDWKYFRLKKLLRKMELYSDKVVVIRNQSDIDRLINSFNKVR